MNFVTTDHQFIYCSGELSFPEVFEHFQYILSNIPGPGQDLATFDGQYEGCVCSACDSVCPCVARFGPSYDRDGLLLVSTAQPAGLQKPIVECNADCACPASCVNREVQRGLRVKVQIERDKRKGFTLCAKEAIGRNKFVCEYAGEVLTHEEARNRSEAMTANDMNYILAVKEHLQDGTLLQTYIDPKKYGNVGRFINHSCEPNLCMIPVRVNNCVPHLALFASRDIDIGEELSFDYSGENSNHRDQNSDQHKPKDDQENGTLRHGFTRKRCFCDSNTCKGFLPFDETLFDILKSV